MTFRSFCTFGLGFCSCLGSIYGSAPKTPHDGPSWISEENIAKTSQLNSNINVLAATLKQTPRQCLKDLRKEISKKSSRPNLLLTESGFSSESLSGSSDCSPSSENLSSPKGYHKSLWSLSESAKARTLLNEVEFPDDLFSTQVTRVFSDLGLRGPSDIWQFMNFVYYTKAKDKPFFTDYFQRWYSLNKNIIDSLIPSLGHLYKNVLSFRGILPQIQSDLHYDLGNFFSLLQDAGFAFSKPADYGTFWESLSLLLGDRVPEGGFMANVMSSIPLWLPLYKKFTIKHPEFSKADFSEYSQQLESLKLEKNDSHEQITWESQCLSAPVHTQLAARKIDPRDSRLVLDWLETVKFCLDPASVFQPDATILWYQAWQEQIDKHVESLFLLHDAVLDQRTLMATISQFTRHSSRSDWSALVASLHKLGSNLTAPKALAEWLEAVSFILGRTFQPTSLVYTLTQSSAGSSQLADLNNLVLKIHSFREGHYPTDDE